jgi:hypothetical protein
MGGFTEFFLRDRTEENIEKQNKILRDYKVPRKFKFYSDEDVKTEYEYFKKKDGNYPEHLFPRDKINSYEDFKKYWSPEALGSCFVPHKGSMSLDCYFGRTSKRAMRNIGRYLAENHREIEKMAGSYDTFMERGMTKLERQIIQESNIRQK